MGPSGKAAVDASKESLALRAAPADGFAATSPAFGGFGGAGLDGGRDAKAGEQGGQESQIKLVGSKTFYLDANGRWMDSEYDGKAETKKTPAFSDDYFSLLKKTPELGKYLALGQRLVVVLDKVAYEIQ